MYYYDFGMNYPFMGAVNLPQNTNIQQTVSYPTSTQLPAKTQTEEKSSSNEKLLWLGLTGLAVLGTYLLTRGHYKGKIPSSSTTSQASASASQAVAEGAGQAVAEGAGQVAKPIPENVANFVNGYKPFTGIEGVSGEVKPVIQQVGSRCRADFTHTINGQNIRETLIFNAEGKPVSRFIETASADGKKVVREAYGINDKGEISDVVQTSTRTRSFNFDKDGNREDGRIYAFKDIINHDVGKCEVDVCNNDIMKKYRYNQLQFTRFYDEKSGKLLYKNISRGLMDARGDIVNWNSHRNFFGYDSEGNLAGIISQNRLTPTDNIQEYIPVENGIFGTPKPIQGHSLYTIIQEGSPKEAEYFELWRQSANPA